MELNLEMTAQYFCYSVHHQQRQSTISVAAPPSPIPPPA
ncbi:hypothetical protein TIFTF001_018847, partial [Ficus carica]